MNYDAENRTFDCEPTLTDTQVLQFCRDGFLNLEGVVPDEINQRACDYLREKHRLTRVLFLRAYSSRFRANP